ILQYLGAEPDLAPLARAQFLRAPVALVWDRTDRHAGGAVAQIDDDAAAVLLEPLQRRVDGLGTIEDVADHAAAMESRQYAFAVTDAPVDEGHVMDFVERRHIRIAGERADIGRDRKLADAVDKLLAHLPVGDEIGDREALDAVAL